LELDQVGLELDQVGLEFDQVRLEFDQVRLEFDQVGFEFDQVDLKLDQVDLKLDQVDLEFDQVGLELDQIGLELDQVDLKLDQVDLKLDQVDLEFDQVDLEFDQVIVAFDRVALEARVAASQLQFVVLESALLRSGRPHSHDDQLRAAACRGLPLNRPPDCGEGRAARNTQIAIHVYVAGVVIASLSADRRGGDLPPARYSAPGRSLLDRVTWPGRLL
jgi:hypothetical protein